VDQQATGRERTGPGVTIDSGRLNGSQGVTTFLKVTDYVRTRFYVNKIVFNEGLMDKRWMKKLLIKLANKYPNRYETYLSHFYPLDQITYYLEKC
jgi:hypothetical protein